MSEDNQEEVPVLGPALLGLHPVGEEFPKPPPHQHLPPQPPEPILNRRGMPIRIRKKNRLFFDDDVVTTLTTTRSTPKKAKSSPAKKPPSATKSATPSPAKKKNAIQSPSPTSNSQSHSKKQAPFSPRHHPRLQSRLHSKPLDSPRSSREESVTPPVSSPDRRIGHKIGMKLRNLLKLPKAHKWVCYEWFYSNIDKPLFEGDNDFMLCLKESFPQLRGRNLTRIEWCKIRRLMGKPRRCSQSFFTEERCELEKKRMKIRLLQQRKAADITNCKDLPSEIPLQLVVGTKVTARLRRPQDGLFNGCIDAVDTSNNTYRVTFERPGLGTHSVPDYEVLSNEPPETITVSSFAQKFRPRPGQFPSPPKQTPPVEICPKPVVEFNSPLLSVTIKPKPVPSEGTLGGFSIKFLELMVRTTKVLDLKRSKITVLKDMNCEAEKRKSFGLDIPVEFQRRYANIIIELEKMNKDLQVYLADIQAYCQEIAPEPSLVAMLTPDYLRDRSMEEARELVDKHNRESLVKSSHTLNIITQLLSLLYQVKSLAGSNRSAYEMKVLKNSIDEIHSTLTPTNQQTFQNCVEIHVEHIQQKLSQCGSLHPFMMQGT